MLKKPGYVTKKYLSRELSKLKEELNVNIGEQLDVKFAEYYEMIVNAVNKNTREVLGIFGTNVQSKLDKQSFDTTTQGIDINSLKYKIDDHHHRIVALERKSVTSVR